jgi:hypothetical protein
MTGVIKVNELQGRSAVDNITVTDGSATMQLQQGLAKAKVSYDGNNNTVRSSFNTSSVADTGTGRYYWNNSNAFADTNTGVLSGATHRTGIQTLCGVSANVQRSTTQWDLNTVNNSASSADAELGALGHGDLA